MGNVIIDERLEFLKAKKARLLKMKKSERGNQLREVDDMISRLNRWNRELMVKQIQENTQNTGRMLAKACQGTSKAVEKMGEALGKFKNRQKQRGVNPVKYR